MALRRSKVERNARQLADAFAAAEAELRDRDEQLASIEAEAATRNAESAAAVGLGNLAVDEHENRKRDAERRVQAARAARATAAEVVEALRPLASAAAAAVSRERIEAAEVDVSRIATAIEETEATLGQLRGEEALAIERVEVCRRQALDAAAAFDPQAAVQAQARATQDEELARWHARNPHEDDRIPVHLRERVPAIRDEEQSREEAERERLRQHPDRRDPAEVYGDGGLRPGERFPQIPMPGDSL